MQKTFQVAKKMEKNVQAVCFDMFIRSKKTVTLKRGG